MQYTSVGITHHHVPEKESHLVQQVPPNQSSEPLNSKSEIDLSVAMEIEEDDDFDYGDDEDNDDDEDVFGSALANKYNDGISPRAASSKTKKRKKKQQAYNRKRYRNKNKDRGRYYDDRYDPYYDDDDDENLELPVEQKLMNKLLRHYERSVRPVRNASDTVQVKMGLTLTQIFDMVSIMYFSLL